MSYLGVPPFGQTVRTVTTQTANGSANTFYPTGGYTVGYLDVFYNGVRVVEAQDYTAGDGNSVTFSAAPTANAVIEMVSYGPISFVDSLVRSGDTMGGTFYVRDLIPAANNTYSLGSSNYRFANLYLSGNTITIGDSTISANATSITFANSTGGAAEVMLPNTGVVSNTYGHSTGIPVVTVDRMGRISNVSIANTQSHHDTAYSNAVSVANTTSFNQAANAYANAVSDATNLAANAYANAVSVANTTSYNQAANAYANVFNGGTFSGNVVFTSNLTANTVRLNGSMQIDGDLIVSGNTVTMNVSSLAVEDNMIYLNDGSAVANPDIGIAGNYNDGTYRHTGVFRDATDGVWKFFHQYEPEPDASAYIDTANNTFKLANVQANTFIGNLSGDASTVGGNTASTLRSYSDTVAGTAYSNATSFAANASNISTGTLSNSRLSGVHTVSSDPNTSGPGTMAIGSNASASWVQSHGGLPLILNPVGNDIRAAKIYDSANTSYFLQSSSTSQLNTVRIGSYANSSHAQLNVSQGGGSATLYRDIDIKGNWAGGEGHAISATHGTTTADMVGQMVFQHDSPGSRIKWGRLYHGGNLSTYPLQLISEGSGGSAYLEQNTGSVRSPIFYDYNDTNYYGDFASGSTLKYLKVNGDWGSSPYGSGHETFTISGTYASFVQRQTNGSLGYWLHHIDGSGLYYLYGGRGDTNGSAWDWSLRAYPNQDGSYVTFRTSARAPIFYDSDDTGYYCNPAGTGRIVSEIIGGHGGTAYDTASSGRLYIGTNADNSYSIYTHMENYGGNYTKLTFDWHTGIKIGAYYGYGGIRFYNNSVNAGGSQVFSVAESDSNVRVTNSIYASAYYYNSDRKLKQNITPLKENIISKLNPVTFDWIESGTNDTGFIAQDVQEVLPVAVNENSVGNILTINHTAIIAHLVAAVQELQREVKELRSR